MQHLYCTKSSALVLSPAVPGAPVQLCHLGHRNTVLAVIHLAARAFLLALGAAGRLARRPPGEEPVEVLPVLPGQTRFCHHQCHSAPVGDTDICAVLRARIGNRAARTAVKVSASPCPRGDNRHLGPRHLCPRDLSGAGDALVVYRVLG